MDKAFEEGCDSVNGKKEIYLPWKNFNGNKSTFYDIEGEALLIASRIHPAWNSCSDAAKRLHARNCYQVMGHALDKPSNQILYWAPTDVKGNVSGGTRTAVELARSRGIKEILLKENISVRFDW